MSEIDRLEQIRRRLGSGRNTHVVLGIGDDCAIIRPSGGEEDWLVSTDLFVEGVHFRRASYSAEDVGHNAVARGLSDIAAMGGEARFGLVSLALPGWADDAWVEGFYDGATRLSESAGFTLVGGDLSSADQLVCDIVACGAVPAGQALRRDRARPGEALYVSGRLGGAALGLETGTGEAWKRLLRPEPRLALGRFLRDELGARAAMDLSDGLSLDLHRLAKESGVQAVIDRPLPVFAGATEEHALHGGEDYELLFTLPPSVEPPPEFRGIELTRIGVVVAGEPGRVVYQSARLEAGGWDHFRKR